RLLATPPVRACFALINNLQKRRRSSEKNPCYRSPGDGSAVLNLRPCDGEKDYKYAESGRRTPVGPGSGCRWRANHAYRQPNVESRGFPPLLRSRRHSRIRLHRIPPDHAGPVAAPESRVSSATG